MSRNPLTLDDHRAIGVDLHRMRNDLLHLSVRLANSYGKTRRSTTLARRAQAAIDKLRCELDSQLCRDHPDHFDAHTYYPGAGAVVTSRTDDPT